MSKELSEMTIAELVAHQGETQAYVQAAVMGERRASASWATIAKQLGVSAGEAHRRYAHIWKWQAAAEGIPTGDNNRPK
jgi:hypothetical protein